MNIPILSLGTVQLGMDYGISNKNGSPGLNESLRMLSFFKDAGFSWVDTAPSYGGSEQLIGESVFSGMEAISSKTTVINESQSWSKSLALLNQGLDLSLEHTCCTCFNVFWLHQPQLLLTKKRQKILDWLVTLKRNGIVKSIGISCFDLSIYPDWQELAAIFDWLQTPFNPLDQKILDKSFQDIRLKNELKIQVRSIFLQGLLLGPPIGSGRVSRELMKVVTNFQRYCSSNHVEPKQLIIDFVKLADVDSVVFGVTSMVELQEALAIWTSPVKRKLEKDSFDCTGLSALDPATWSAS